MELRPERAPLPDGEEPHTGVAVTLVDIHRAVANRATRKQQIALAILLLRFQGQGRRRNPHAAGGRGARVRARGSCYMRRSARFTGTRSCTASGSQDGAGPPDLKSQEIMVTRVRHAEYILMLRATGWTSEREFRPRRGPTSRATRSRASGCTTPVSRCVRSGRDTEETVTPESRNRVGIGDPWPEAYALTTSDSV
jgi:hypothetical protein